MIDTCPLCSSTSFLSLYEVSDSPTQQCTFYASQEEATSCPTGSIDLVRCRECHFVWNRSLDPMLVSYDAPYNSEQHHSHAFTLHLNETMSRLRDFGAHHKKVVEIGCGRGHFLELLEANGFDIVGYDPAYPGSNPKITKDYFSASPPDRIPEVFIIRHTLEHIYQPLHFLRTIAESAASNASIFIEVPDYEPISRAGAFWDIYYEHCNYFTRGTLASMFQSSVTGSAFGEHYLYLWGRLGDLRVKVPKTTATDFPNQFRSRIESVRELIQKHRDDIAIWGIGGKGSTFLNTLDPQRKDIRYAIDVHPSKQGLFVPGSGHRIVGPDVLKENPVGMVLVMNPNYCNEATRIINNPETTVVSL